MKTLKTLALVSLLVTSMTTSAFASWWNPFTWFKQLIPVRQNFVVTASSSVATSSPKANVPPISTYINKQHGYEISYPVNAKISFEGLDMTESEKKELRKTHASTSVDWYDSTCVRVSSNDGNNLSRAGWSVQISSESQFSASPCAPTGLSSTSHRAKDTLVLNGKNMEATGWVENDNSSRWFSLPVSVSGRTITVVYEMNTKSAAQQVEYLRILHDIISTLKIQESFVPTTPPDIGRG